MKRTHLIAIIMLAIAIAALIFSTKDISSYSTFTKAQKKGGVNKIVGTLSPGDPIIYDPMTDPNFFSFYMLDEEGVKSKVILHEPKTRDFEKTESIVITGSFNEEGDFVAKEILLKCPSKYKDEELALRNRS